MSTGARRALGAIGLAGGLFLLSGCGAVFHASQTVTIHTDPKQKASVYQAGIPLPANTPGDFQTKVFLASPLGDVVAVAPGMHIRRVDPGRYVDAVAIICDVLWTATIIGVAAPISDLALGTFVKSESDVDAKLVPFPETDNPMPVYAVGGTTITASEDAPPPAPNATTAPPPPPPTSGSPASAMESTPPKPAPKGR